MQLTSIFLYALIVIYVIYHQLQPKQLKYSPKKLLILVLLGVYFTLNALDQHQLVLNLKTGASLAFSLLVLAIGFGALRALTCKIWQENGIYYRQATWVTLLLWILMIVMHGAVDHLTGVGSSTLFLYLALTLTTQRLVLVKRAQKLK